MTMDAGPNVKVLCRESEMDEFVNELSQIFQEKIITSKPGPAAYILSEEEWRITKKFEKFRT